MSDYPLNSDILISGAGPAGSTAAVLLAQKGYRVRLLDRCAFPRDKVCGDGIGAMVISMLHDLGLGDEIVNQPFYPMDGAKIVSPNGNQCTVHARPKEEGALNRIWRRYDFDYLLQQHAIRCGAEFQQARTLEPLMADDRVAGVKAVVDDESLDLRSRVVIAADGVHSSIARALRPNRQQDRHRLITLRGYLHGIETTPGLVEFHFPRAILPGYIWIFPMGDNYANIGLGMRVDHYRRSRESLRSLLDNFLQKQSIRERLHPNWKIEELGGSDMNMASQKKVQRSFDGALLIGDAGAWVDPLTGGGICNAMISAHIAAEVIDQALQRGDSSRRALIEYERICADRILKEVRRSYRLQRLFTSVPSVLNSMAYIGSHTGLLSRFANRLYTDLEFS